MLDKKQDNLELSTQQVGKSGEAFVLHDLLRQGIECFVPANDERNTDIVIYKHGFKRIQVKTLRRSRRGTSVEVRMRKESLNHTIDYLAIFLWYEKLVAYYPYSGQKSVTLGLRKAKNSQSKREWFYEYEELV